MEDKKLLAGKVLSTENISKYSELLGLVFIKENKEEEEYLEDLVSKLSISKKKNFTKSRSIVMDIHLRLESMLNSCIRVCCAVGAMQYQLVADTDKVADAISDIDFLKKLTIIKSLSIIKPSSIDRLIKMNNLRRAFAHGYRTEHKDYNYYDGSIFERKTIEKLRADYREILHEILEGKIFG